MPYYYNQKTVGNFFLTSKVMKVYEIKTKLVIHFFKTWEIGDRIAIRIKFGLIQPTTKVSVFNLDKHKMAVMELNRLFNVLRIARLEHGNEEDQKMITNIELCKAPGRYAKDGSTEN